MTVFSVQRFLEDRLEHQGLEDIDQYAIRAANAFEHLGPEVKAEAVARELARIRTVFFRRNHHLDRRSFETQLAAALQRRFKKKRTVTPVSKRLGAVCVTRARDSRIGGDRSSI